MLPHNLADLIRHGVVWYFSGEKVSSVEDWGVSPPNGSSAKQFVFGSPQVDLFLGQYPCFESGAVHEFFFANELSVKSRNVWFPAAEIISQLVVSTVRSCGAEKDCPPVFWLGSKIYPSAHLLKRRFIESGLRWEHRNFFIDPDSKQSRHAAALDILRSSSAFAMVMDGSGLILKATRQLQLAAEQSGTFCFVLRPPWEIDTASTAHTKWRISALPECDSNLQRSWKLELYKAKGARAPMEWVISEYRSLEDIVDTERKVANLG
jgi:hypothetical protein